MKRAGRKRQVEYDICGCPLMRHFSAKVAWHQQSGDGNAGMYNGRKGGEDREW